MKENTIYTYGIVEKKCAKCGKTFIPAPMHAYRKGRKYYCSWTCYLHRDDITLQTNQHTETKENKK